MEKRLAEIKERKAAILEELDGADQEKLTALNAEADALNTEEKELRSKMDLKGKIKPIADEQTEDRAAKFARDGRMAIPVSETRSTLLSGGKIATPTGVGGIGERAVPEPAHGCEAGREVLALHGITSE